MAYNKLAKAIDYCHLDLCKQSQTAFLISLHTPLPAAGFIVQSGSMPWLSFLSVMSCGDCVERSHC